MNEVITKMVMRSVSIDPAMLEEPRGTADEIEQVMAECARQMSASQAEFVRRLDLMLIQACIGFQSVKQAAKMLGVSWDAARRLYWAGKIHLHRPKRPMPDWDWQII